MRENTEQALIDKISYTDFDTKVKATVHSNIACNAFIDLNDKRYDEFYGIKEPYDPFVHCFMLDKDALVCSGDFSVIIKSKKLASPASVSVVFDISEIAPYDKTVASMNRNFKLKSSFRKNICEGVEYFIEHYETASNEPVVSYVLKYAPEAAEFHTGTPNGTYQYKNQKQTVISEAKYEISQGKRVIAAFNADFFDMFDDCSPSGLCVKDGIVIANPDSNRYFFGVLKDGSHIIENLKNKPSLLSDIQNAVGGRELLLSDSEICDVSAGDPFGHIPHPRTAVGICSDQSVIISVVDGRRPQHSNGASLYDMAELLKRHGAVRALNLDGGGSSTFIIENKDGLLEMINHPADLTRPDDDLIRDVFNSILIVEKQRSYHGTEGL